MTAIWNAKQTADSICTTSSTASAVHLIRFPSLSASSKLVVTFNGDVASRLSRSNTPTSAQSAYGSASITDYPCVPASASVTDNRLAACAANCTAMIALYLSVATGPAVPAG
ncbi:hypothetical protein PO002_20550 [Cupriavidus necator]|uniref:hypothetical protein n=1 Tax=Cupriavidus necator TaxID=106590 RepID=UPI0039C07CE3